METASGSNRLICSYFEPEWQNADMDEIRQHGFNTVLLCVTEEMLARRPKYVQRTSDYARSIGLEVWGDLWAFGKVFGGEADSPFAERKTPHHDDPEFNDLVDDGIGFVSALGARVIFWDEPHFKNCSCCRGREVDFVLRQANRAKSYGLLNSVCLTSSDDKLQVLEYMASQSQIDDIATDPYYGNFPGTNQDDTADNYVGYYAAKINQIADQHGKTGHIWVQGFSLPTGYEEIPLMAAEAATRAGIKSLGFWGFRACQATPENTPDNPDKVWQIAQQITSISA